ncbi:arylsulfatase [Acetobacter sacchari]|uniref:Arylsulfatase n=2 Tax=Acetobacter sacchari TaxID=2661687 RepID=A0ABS3M158_9PROT|nr:arylsulfatase [Acetobacter sacchari]
MTGNSMTTLTRRALLSTTAQATMAAALPSIAHAGPQPRRRPNIIYIIADDLGVYDLGCYGQKKIRTPNIDALAANGMLFNSAYGGAPICSPSRCALMTGKNMGHSTIRDNFALQGGIIGKRGKESVRRIGLAPGEKTVATAMAEAGYVTGLVGKWHLDGYDPNAIPTRHGFQEFHGWLTQTETTQGYFPTQWYSGEKLGNIPENADGKQAVYETDICTDQACDFIRKNQKSPFFLTLAYNAPHSPHITPTTGSYAGRPWGEYEKNYAAMIEFLDAGVGAVVQTVREAGLEKDTVIFVSSDHGPRSEPTAEQTEVVEFFDSHGSLRGYKRDLYEGGIRVPLIVSWPGHIRAGSVSDEPVYHPDFLPTAVALAGNGRLYPDMDGADISPVLLGRGGIASRYLYWETYEPSFWQAARHGRWKAVKPVGGGEIQLFDLLEDSSETRDVSAENSAIVESFVRCFKECRVASPNYI